MQREIGQSQNQPRARQRIVIILISMTAIAIAFLFLVSLAYFRSLDRETAATRMSLYERSLNDALERYQYLPFVIAQDPLVENVLRGTPPEKLNLRLWDFAEKSGLEAIYLMDISGTVLAASNFDQRHSFIGQNYSFRPYFQQAMAKKRGNYFGVGATTGRPGFFVSEPVKPREDAVLGVIAIKLDMSELQHVWERGGENVFASNPDGIVVLSSQRKWLFKSLAELSAKNRTTITDSKQFGKLELPPLQWKSNDNGVAQLNGDNYIYSSTKADHLDWQVHFLLSDGRAYERTWLTTAIFGSFIALLVGVAAYLRSKRIQIALANSQFDRTQLIKTNQELEKAHDELARTSKLAALGQLAASVVHELGQPISAMRNYLIAAEIDCTVSPHPSQEKLNGIADRMDNITQQLRFFINPGQDKMIGLQLEDIVETSLELMKHDLADANVEISREITDETNVHGNALRLEQVLVNLLRNALFALRDNEHKELTITLSNDRSSVFLAVIDNGIGIGDRDLAVLQEPFHTTKSSGEGMGLGLSIATAIIQEHKGTLSAANNSKGGATFTIQLPSAHSGEGK